jgi:Na+/melibiose symporter-like transporter
VARPGGDVDQVGRAFRRVLAAEVVSNFGSMLSRIAVPWLAVLVLEATPFEMGLLLVADVAASVIGSLLLGTFVDRAGKRAVMIAADGANALLLGTLAWLASGQLLDFWILMLARAAGGLATVTFELARSAWVAQRVDAAQLPLRNAQISAGGSLSEAAAFALGGWLYQALGAALALVIDAASYVISATCLRGVPEAAPAAASAARKASIGELLAQARAGLAAIAAVPTLRALAAIEALVALGMSLAGTAYMIFVARDLAIETGVLGLIFAAGGIGSLLGAALAPRLGRRWGSGGAMAAGLALLALGTGCLVFAPGATLAGGLLLIAHQVIGDGGHAVHDVHDRTLRQTAAPPPLRARADAGIRTLGQLATLAGAIGGGALATVAGTRFALGLAAALFAAAAALTYTSLVTLRR